MRVTEFLEFSWQQSFSSHWSQLLSVLCIHSMIGYAIGRNMGNSKFYKFAYLYIVSGMFVPFAILMMPLVKQTSQMGIGNRAGVIILYVVFYMPMNLLLYSGYLEKLSSCTGRGCKSGRSGNLETYWSIIFPVM